MVRKPLAESRPDVRPGGHRNGAALWLVTTIVDRLGGRVFLALVAQNPVAPPWGRREKIADTPVETAHYIGFTWIDDKMLPTPPPPRAPPTAIQWL